MRHRRGQGPFCIPNCERFARIVGHASPCDSRRWHDSRCSWPIGITKPQLVPYDQPFFSHKLRDNDLAALRNPYFFFSYSDACTSIRVTNSPSIHTNCPDYSRIVSPANSDPGQLENGCDVHPFYVYDPRSHSLPQIVRHHSHWHQGIHVEVYLETNLRRAAAPVEDGVVGSRWS